eukprot:7250993-Prorocentrum_lima.AAC.1
MFLVSDSTLSLRDSDDGRKEEYGSTLEDRGFKAANRGSFIKCGGTAAAMVEGLEKAAEHHSRLGAEHPSGQRHF